MGRLGRDGGRCLVSRNDAPEQFVEATSGVNGGGGIVEGTSDYLGDEAAVLQCCNGATTREGDVGRSDGKLSPSAAQGEKLAGNARAKRVYKTD